MVMMLTMMRAIAVMGVMERMMLMVLLGVVMKKIIVV